MSSASSQANNNLPSVAVIDKPRFNSFQVGGITSLASTTFVQHITSLSSLSTTYKINEYFVFSGKFVNSYLVSCTKTSPDSSGLFIAE